MTTSFFSGQAKTETVGKSLYIALDRLIQHLRLHIVEVGNISIYHNHLTANIQDALHEVVTICDHLLGGSRLRQQGSFRRLLGLLFHHRVLYHYKAAFGDWGG